MAEHTSDPDTPTPGPWDRHYLEEHPPRWPAGSMSMGVIEDALAEMPPSVLRAALADNTEGIKVFAQALATDARSIASVVDAAPVAMPDLAASTVLNAAGLLTELLTHRSLLVRAFRAQELTDEERARVPSGQNYWPNIQAAYEAEQTIANAARSARDN